MKKSPPIIRCLFPLILTTITLVGCGGNISDIGILKQEGEYSGREVAIGTYDFKDIVFAYNYEDGPSTELYVALDYGQESAQSLHNLKAVNEHCYFMPEKKEGSYQSQTVFFNYKSTMDLKAGTASDISNEEVVSGSLTAADVAYVNVFLDAAAEWIKSFLDNRRSYQGMTAKWLVDKLKDLVLNLPDHDDPIIIFEYTDSLKLQYSITLFDSAY